ncbi:hypothetical protein OC842_002062 [Tilletia horrida]|uniref:Oxidoreductase molybdopterin-binding domain-containing protein n=1 Tax=Tilletia horrida TaxID=155126 RepID=A0AAN6GDX9_9BASI|nr:hypothetical protein OC842_002062 [Tilletia horrida]
MPLPASSATLPTLTPAGTPKDSQEDAPPTLDPPDWVPRSLTPFNAEPKITALIESGGFYTPQRLLFHRNRDPLPGRAFPHSIAQAQDESWTIDLDVEDQLREQWGLSSHQAQRVFTLAQFKTDFGPSTIVTATLECAGNRRSEMSQVHKTEGIQWSAGVIANAAFLGLSLRTFLLHSGLPDPYSHLTPPQRAALAPSEASIEKHAPLWARQTHVHFVSAQRSEVLALEAVREVERERGKGEEEKERAQWFASSISLATAMLPAQQCLLSWGLCSNAVDILPHRTLTTQEQGMTQESPRSEGEAGIEVKVEPLEHAHGFPLRAVLPGHAGARWVKWIRAIRIERQMNTSAPMKDDYKMLLPPSSLVGAHITLPIGTPTATAIDPTWLAAFQSAQHRAEVMASLPPLMRLTAGSAVSSPAEGERVVLSGSRGGQIKVKGYAVGQDGAAVQSVLLRLVPDNPALSAPELRALAALDNNKKDWQEASILTRDAAQIAQLAQAGRSAELGAGTSPSPSPSWVWSWTLWQAELDARAALKECEAHIRWALVVKTVTTAGVEQVQTAPWNLRGFCQRSWPVVRGLQIVVEAP